jgi:molybdopterin/thiamine biosynthesis adenylyltransferase
MLNRKFKIKDTIDIFISETEYSSIVLIIFHKMTTRDRIELKANKSVAQILALLNGKDRVIDILDKIGNYDKKQALKLFEFLTHNHLITDINNDQKNHRYKRQISYFDDMILDQHGEETQLILESKKVVILGCGSVGSSIAEILVRAGILDITLVDYKKITEQNLARHLFASTNHIGMYKAVALANFCREINANLNVRIHCEMLLPNTDLSKWIPNNTSIVINSCDEPYIGHTSLKIGRFLNDKHIALYIMGGFDAHLMSSGELILPPQTPCIDCAQQTFTKALGAWKPVYSDTTATNPEYDMDNYLNNSYIAGGPGGLAIMSGFSSNLSALNILQFLTSNGGFTQPIKRYEYLINKGQMTDFVLQKQDNCNVCNK